MATNDSQQVPWTDEQWARVNQVIQEEASRARVAATFLPLYGPLPPDTDFVRKETIDEKTQLMIADKETIQLATLQVKVHVRGAQMADPEMRSVLALFRRAANMLARLEDDIVFNGQVGANEGPHRGQHPQICEVQGGAESDGLLYTGAKNKKLVTAAPVPAAPAAPAPAAPPPSRGELLVTAVSEAIGDLERDGHLGPFAVVLDQRFFADVQTPNNGTLVLPQDRIIPFLGGGPLLRSSTLPVKSGVVVALGGAPVELVVATDMSVGFLQVTTEPMFVFRVFEKLVLRIKQPGAIIAVVPPESAVWSVSPRRGPTGKPVTVRGVNFENPHEATGVSFDATPVAGNHFRLVSDTEIKVQTPRHEPGEARITVTGEGVTPGPSDPYKHDTFTYERGSGAS